MVLKRAPIESRDKQVGFVTNFPCLGRCLSCGSASSPALFCRVQQRGFGVCGGYQPQAERGGLVAGCAEVHRAGHSADHPQRTAQRQPRRPRPFLWSRREHHLLQHVRVTQENATRGAFEFSVWLNYDGHAKLCLGAPPPFALFCSQRDVCSPPCGKAREKH